MGEKRNAYRLLVGKPEGKRLLGRPRRRFGDNIRMDLGVVGLGDADWIGLAQDRNRWRANSLLTFGFHKLLANYRVASQLVASRVVLSSVELVICPWKYLLWTDSPKLPGYASGNGNITLVLETFHDHRRLSV
jgi:hypothetical protein